MLGLDVVAGDGGHQFVPTHADVPMDDPDRHGHVLATERSVPGHGVVVVGVDQGAVDVEDHCAHPGLPLSTK